MPLSIPFMVLSAPLPESVFVRLLLPLLLPHPIHALAESSVIAVPIPSPCIVFMVRPPPGWVLATPKRQDYRVRGALCNEPKSAQ
jgi:hypothetical protein